MHRSGSWSGKFSAKEGQSSRPLSWQEKLHARGSGPAIQHTVSPAEARVNALVEQAKQQRGPGCKFYHLSVNSRWKDQDGAAEDEPSTPQVISDDLKKMHLFTPEEHEESSLSLPDMVASEVNSPPEHLTRGVSRFDSGLDEDYVMVPGDHDTILEASEDREYEIDTEFGVSQEEIIRRATDTEEIEAWLIDGGLKLASPLPAEMRSKFKHVRETLDAQDEYTKTLKERWAPEGPAQNMMALKLQEEARKMVRAARCQTAKKLNIAFKIRYPEICESLRPLMGSVRQGGDAGQVCIDLDGNLVIGGIPFPIGFNMSPEDSQDLKENIKTALKTAQQMCDKRTTITAENLEAMLEMIQEDSAMKRGCLANISKHIEQMEKCVDSIIAHGSESPSGKMLRPSGATPRCFKKLPSIAIRCMIDSAMEELGIDSTITKPGADDDMTVEINGESVSRGLGLSREECINLHYLKFRHAELRREGFKKGSDQDKEHEKIVEKILDMMVRQEHCVKHSDLQDTTKDIILEDMCTEILKLRDSEPSKAQALKVACKEFGTELGERLKRAKASEVLKDIAKKIVKSKVTNFVKTAAEASINEFKTAAANPETYAGDLKNAVVLKVGEEMYDAAHNVIYGKNQDDTWMEASKRAAGKQATLGTVQRVISLKTAKNPLSLAIDAPKAAVTGYVTGGAMAAAGRGVSSVLGTKDKTVDGAIMEAMEPVINKAKGKLESVMTTLCTSEPAREEVTQHGWGAKVAQSDRSGASFMRK